MSKNEKEKSPLNTEPKINMSENYFNLTKKLTNQKTFQI